ncbi:MAG: hypothetical protein AMS27_18065, partial [Bacteroides sp. SM23_62_1]
MRRYYCYALLGLAFFCSLYLSASAVVAHPILKEYIIEYNLEALGKSLKDDSYRGEEGILRIKPEIANELGIKAFIDEDYKDSIRLFKEADKALAKAREHMVSRKKEKISGYYAKNIADNFIIYKRKSLEAQEKLLNYRSRLTPEIDERFDNNICETILDRVLRESLTKADNRLRDGLGYYYNISQGIDGKAFPLTTENIRFV